MIELAKPSGEEKAYRVVLLLCSIGGFAIGLTEILLHLIVITREHKPLCSITAPFRAQII
jgi:hypothetical protein